MTTATQEKTPEQLWAEADAAEAKTAAADVGVVEDRAVREEQQEAAPAQADAAPAAEAKNDEPDIDPRVKDQLIGLQTMVEQLQSRLRNAEGHVGGLKSQLAEAMKAKAPSAEQLSAATSNPQAWAQMAEEYPDFFKTFKAAIDPLLLEVENLKRAGPQEPSAAIDQRIDLVRREMAVEIRHPGWQETIQTPGFRGWMAQQPREVQMLAYSDQPKDAVRLLDLHAQAAKRPASTSQVHNSIAALPGSRPGTPGVRTVDTSKMTKQELWAYMDQLDAQRA